MRVTDKSQPLDKQQAAGMYFFISFSFFFLFFFDFPHARPPNITFIAAGGLLLI
jgi:hypothetical protein